jgi:hypothetical protein
MSPAHDSVQLQAALNATYFALDPLVLSKVFAYLGRLTATAGYQYAAGELHSVTMFENLARRELTMCDSRTQPALFSQTLELPPLSLAVRPFLPAFRNQSLTPTTKTSPFSTTSKLVLL